MVTRGSSFRRTSGFSARRVDRLADRGGCWTHPARARVNTATGEARSGHGDVRSIDTTRDRTRTIEGPTMRHPRASILFVDSFTTLDGPSPVISSDALGYGITCSAVIRRGLSERGYNVLRPAVAVPQGTGDLEYRTAWNLAMYAGILALLATGPPPDLIMCFHAFGAFPAEIRRMTLDIGMSIPIIGYTHGSHWDPSDGFRTERYPGMELVDLANLDVLDRVLLASDPLKRVLIDQIGEMNPQIAKKLADTAVIVGLPLDTTLLDACRTEARFDRTTVVYNHAPIASKNPKLFLDAMMAVMSRYDINILLTRRFPASGQLDALVRAFGDRVMLGNDLSVEEYYAMLWMSDVQVSTATHESLGVSTLEAMYTHNYCIAPRIGSYPTILGRSHEGLYDGSKTELVSQLARAIEEADRRTVVARQLSDLARRYSPSVVIDRLVSVIEEAIVQHERLTPRSNRHRYYARPSPARGCAE